MQFLYDTTGAQLLKRPFPLYGAGTDIKKGAAVILGTTGGTNQGFGIIAPTNTSMSSGLFLGVAEAKFAAGTIDNDPSAGTKYILTDVIINPHAVFEAQYDNRFGANALTIASVLTGNPTVTSLEDISGGWLFGDDYQLRYVLSVSAGAATLKSASTWTTSNKVSKIIPIGKPKITLITDGTQIGTATAAQGNVQFTVLENYIRGVGYDNVLLDPTKHDGITLPSPNSVTPAILAAIQNTQHFLLTH